jgi:hypothetical protein
MCQAPAAPAPPSLAPRAAPAPRRHSPPRASPLLASPHRAAAARATTHPAGLPAPALARPSLLLDPEHVLKLPTHSPLPSCVCISTTLLFLELSTSPDLRRSYCLSSTAAAAAAHPRSRARVAPQQPTKAHKPAQFHSPTLDRPDHSAGELELPPLLGLAVVPSIHCLLAPAKHTISTTSSCRSSLATSPPPSGTPATGTPTPPLGAPPPALVHRRYVASALLFPNTGHPRDRREPLNLSPHFPLTAGEPPRWNLIGTDWVSCVARPRIQLQGFESFQGSFCRKSVPLSNFKSANL